MPRTRAANARDTDPVTELPRKRKRVEDDDRAETTLGPLNSSKETTTHQLLDSISSKPVKRGRKAVELKDEIISPSKRHASAKSMVKRSVKTEERSVRTLKTSKGPKQASQQVSAETETAVPAESDDVDDTTDAISRKERSNVKEVAVDTLENANEETTKPSRKRKTKEEKEAENMPLLPRTQGLKMFVGAHVSIAKGVENAISNAVHIGGNAFALFLKSQRKWENPALKSENRDAFKQACTHQHYNSSSHVVPHGSYLVNLASADVEMSKKSYDAFVDDLHRCEALGIKHYNFHPGSTNGKPLQEAIERLSNNINRALAETKTVVPLLENMAGHGSIIGSRFSDLRDVIAGIKPEYKSRVGICIDTCHAFAAGYDLRSPEAFKKTFQELDDTVGLKYLKAMHINDSKAPFDSHRDLHQNIGKGFLGLRAFHNVMNDHRLQDIPLILETPCDKPDPKNPKKTLDDKNVWAREIKLLESLIGMDAEGKEFRQLEADLSEQGRAEREKMQQSIDAKEEKARKKAAKEVAKGQKSIGDMFGSKAGNKKRKTSASSSDQADSESDA